MFVIILSEEEISICYNWEMKKNSFRLLTLKNINLINNDNNNMIFFLNQKPSLFTQIIAN